MLGQLKKLVLNVLLSARYCTLLIGMLPKCRSNECFMMLPVSFLNWILLQLIV